MQSCVPPAFAESEKDIRYAAGVADYKRGEFNSALTNFAASRKEGNASADNYLYIAHCYAALGDRLQATKVYNEIKRLFPASGPAKMAEQCIQKLGPSATAIIKTDAQKSLQTRTGTSGGRAPAFINRITVVAPTIAGHQPVGSQTVGTVRSIISRLPSNVYSILEESGATVTIAPNITDKWPEKRNQTKPGMEHMTLDQDHALTEGRDIYIWERSISEVGGKDLDEPIDANSLHDELVSQFGQAINNYIGISNEKDFVSNYDGDAGKLLADDKRRLKYYLQPDGEGAKVVCSAAIAETLGADPDSAVDKFFPKTKTWVKERLDNEYRKRSALAMKPGRGVSKTSLQAANTKVALAKPPSAFEAKGADSKTATLSMPPEERIPYDRHVGNHLYVRGEINGHSTHILLDTGAFKVCIGRKELVALGIKPPEGASEIVGSGAAGALRGWEMPLEITIGRIKRKLPVQVVEGSQPMLLGQPFLAGMHYQVDRNSSYIRFIRDSKDFAKEMSYDSVEIPFRMLNGNMMVTAKVNGHSTEMNFDTGAPYTLFTAMSMFSCDLKVLGRTEVHGVGGSSSGAFVCHADTIELGGIRKTGVQVVVSPSCGHDVLGQDFFGHTKFLVDNEKHVIRMAR